MIASIQFFGVIIFKQSYLRFWCGQWRLVYVNFKPLTLLLLLWHQTKHYCNILGVLQLAYSSVIAHCVWRCTSEIWVWSGLFQKAEAQLAYELQAAKEQQKIRLEEIEIQVVQRKKQITIEEKEIDRTDKELIAIVKRPAEAEAYKMKQLAEGQK